MKIYVFNDERKANNIKAYLKIINGISLLRNGDNVDKNDDEFYHQLLELKDYAIDKLDDELANIDAVCDLSEEISENLFKIYEKDYILKSTIGSCIMFKDEFTTEIVDRMKNYKELQLILKYVDKGKGLIIC